MRQHIIPCLILLATSLPAAGDQHATRVLLDGGFREPLIVIETKDCSGTTGLASFQAERVFKVEGGACADPDNPGEQLKQLFLLPATRGGERELLWLDASAAADLAKQLRENREAALRRADLGIGVRDQR